MTFSMLLLMLMMMIAFCIICILFTNSADSHIALTFPPVRYPPLDFLDSTRTTSPCGIPLPRQVFNQAQYTDFLIGQSYNITWRTASLHQGGNKLSLLDSNGRFVQNLTQGYIGEGQTRESAEVIFKKACSGCIIQVERQALDLGHSFTYHSCADVNILTREAKDDGCSGKGTRRNNVCECETGAEGDRCQYSVECTSDSDCLNGGRCVENPKAPILKTCFCAPGFSGSDCSKTHGTSNEKCFAYETFDISRYKAYGMLNPLCYNRVQLSDDDFLYFRKVDKEVEIILDFSGTSWVGIGWRPAILSPTCRLFPDLEGVRYKRSTAGDKRESRQAPPTHIAQEGAPPIMPRSNGFLDDALNAPLHPMDCVDMIIASVVDGKVSVRDMYSRDRSTPLDDSWYDGENSLTYSTGMEVDGRTIVMFRRHSQEIEPTDHPLGPGEMHVVWAKGQRKGEFSHSDPSLNSLAEEVGFYPEDQLKYHGVHNRDSLMLDFHREIEDVPQPEPLPIENTNEPRGTPIRKDNMERGEKLRKNQDSSLRREISEGNSKNSEQVQGFVNISEESDVDVGTSTQQTSRHSLQRPQTITDDEDYQISAIPEEPLSNVEKDDVTNIPRNEGSTIHTGKDSEDRLMQIPRNDITENDGHRITSSDKLASDAPASEGSTTIPTCLTFLYIVYFVVIAVL